MFATSDILQMLTWYRTWDNDHGTFEGKLVFLVKKGILTIQIAEIETKFDLKNDSDAGMSKAIETLNLTISRAGILEEGLQRQYRLIHGPFLELLSYDVKRRRWGMDSIFNRIDQ